jgi:hypothetical protein
MPTDSGIFPKRGFAISPRVQAGRECKMARGGNQLTKMSANDAFTRSF